MGTTKRNVVLFANTDFAKYTIYELVKTHNLKAVVTYEKSPMDKFIKKSLTDVEMIYTRQEGLMTDELQQQLKNLEPDLFVVIAYYRLPKEVYSIPTYGTFNVHASLLPNYRGAAPIEAVLMNGEKETGLTSFMIEDKIDTGPIIKLSDPVKISDTDNYTSLSKKLSIAAAPLTLETIELLTSDKAVLILQDVDGDYKKAPKITYAMREICHNDTVENVLNHIRALSGSKRPAFYRNPGKKPVFIIEAKQYSKERYGFHKRLYRLRKKCKHETNSSYFDNKLILNVDDGAIDVITVYNRVNVIADARSTIKYDWLFRGESGIEELTIDK